jgi:tRNA (uracil-5-)-methyltransferase TRM9
LNLNPNIFMVGSDRSGSLVSLAADRSMGSRKGRDEAVIGDILNLPHPLGSFDFAVCIAVVHHLANHERRVEAIRSVLSLLKPSFKDQDPKASATALLYVWALEQKGSRRGWDENSSQDVMVPWILRNKSKPKAEGASEKVFQRYYHLYRKDELEQSIQEAGGHVVESGYEKDNWWAIARIIPG